MASETKCAILMSMVIALAIFNVGEPALTILTHEHTTRASINLYGAPHEKLFCTVADCDSFDTVPNPYDTHLFGCVICGKTLASIVWVFEHGMEKRSACPACAHHRSLSTQLDTKPARESDKKDTCWLQMLLKNVHEVHQVGSFMYMTRA